MNAHCLVRGLQHSTIALVAVPVASLFVLDPNRAGAEDTARPVTKINVSLAKENIGVPGHGAVGNRAQLIEVRDLRVAIHKNVAALEAKGKSPEEVIAARPSTHDARLGAFVIDPAFFFRRVHRGV